jgi:hypothetical protein
MIHGHTTNNEDGGATRSHTHLRFLRHLGQEVLQVLLHRHAAGVLVKLDAWAKEERGVKQGRSG